MKAPPFVFLAALLFPLTVPADDVSQLLTQGQRAYMSGDTTTAKQDFEMVLAVDPTNRTATTYLRMIRVTQPASGPSVEAQKQYASIRIPSIQLTNATLGSTLQYLKQLLEKQTGGSPDVNFVVQLPPDALQDQVVSLKLADVPFTEVLRYVGELAHVTFNYERYAIVVKGVEASASTAPAAATQ